MEGTRWQKQNGIAGVCELFKASVDVCRNHGLCTACVILGLPQVQLARLPRSLQVTTLRCTVIGHTQCSIVSTF